MSRTLQESRALFDDWASTYDRDLVDPSGPLTGYRTSLDTAFEMAGNHDRVLDIGIGTGGFASLFHQRGSRIVGVDISEKMLEQCREQYPDFVLQQGSFTPLPFKAGEFDAAISSFCFHEVASAERPEALAEVYRVLKPGGLFCLLDILFASIPAREDARRAIGKHWDEEEDYPLVEKVDTWLRQAGFASVQWRQTAPCHWVAVAKKRESC
ncbi:class I SAM-dependent methyltransferase [Desmospora profundinema]|uniref:Ubiquinone/menaquinone biosynthesis C-methylase UbiE n=1 Tax=Desmospora profundinema TaxID=1571184 RepID=A0ABU1IK10_9BACL|nr:class I SAM-dependent methyltransferase [Desmospora profundinema]MDR6224155.1 ubiquinone/menaquinone biosynthesis C-methylase UbiE [Desmospora profundinema]